ncbi:MAG: hypothetical protein A2W93_02685 [Bacteroidetes bacterium GWF2_43_63]|nr:MAG: hypothetical protein A2W93_02685 [Bacteroidetes bacterium GWF2_43_63]HBG71093.1 hypothetical protein [Bacteroidales bacterium]
MKGRVQRLSVGHGLGCHGKQNVECIPDILARLSQNNAFFKNNIPSSESDEGARGYGIVVFEAVTTIPYSGRILSLEGFRTLRGISNRPERWNIVTFFYFKKPPGIVGNKGLTAPNDSGSVPQL